MKRITIAALVLATALLLGGCAAGPNALGNAPDPEGHVAGFGLGVWHGVIAPVHVRDLALLGARAPV